MWSTLKRNAKSYLPITIIPILFLVLATATLSHYGINWDEPYHFMRGQVYLHYFLTREKDYKSLPPYPRLTLDCASWVKPEDCPKSPEGASDTSIYSDEKATYEDEIKKLYPEGRWRSFFQSDIYDFNDVIKLENGHPAIGDIMAALSNYVFFQNLKIMGDIESYHFFEVFVSFLLVGAVAIFVYLNFGIFASVVASFSLAVYPLFFSESHFNIKDPPEAAFFGLAIIFFYLAITKNKWKLMIFSALFSAFALGTKFNALFIAPILILWLLVYLIFLFLSHGKAIVKKINLRKIWPLGISLILYPAIVGGIFYTLWPYLWQDPFKNILVIINYYRQIGLGTPSELANYLFGGWNTYPIVWIFYTTPIPILVLSLFGILTCLYLFLFKKNHFSFLVLVWFSLPIARVTIPKSAIYGGVRQIMEFLPAMAILVGIGAWALLSFARKISKKNLGFYRLIAMAIVSSLIFVVYEMASIHPNENVYFNQIIGGLSGARDKKIPYWGNSYGNAYLQGIKWLNENAEPNAKLGLPLSTMGNLPKLKLRADIDFYNRHWSGPNREGEYEMELDFDWPAKAWYSFAYYDTFLKPAYEVKVDDVPILKVWKNDIKHTRGGFDEEKVYPYSSLKIEEGSLKVDLDKEIYLTRFIIGHANINCQTQKGGYISISTDGNNWLREPEPIQESQVPDEKVGFTDTNFVFLFAGKPARYVSLDTQMDNSCILKNPQIEIRGLKNVPTN